MLPGSLCPPSERLSDSSTPPRTPSFQSDLETASPWFWLRTASLRPRVGGALHLTSQRSNICCSVSCPGPATPAPLSLAAPQEGQGDCCQLFPRGGGQCRALSATRRGAVRPPALSRTCLTRLGLRSEDGGVRLRPGSLPLRLCKAGGHVFPGAQQGDAFL